MAKPGQQTGDAVGTARDRSLIIVGQKEKNLIKKIASWITRLGWIPLAVSFCAYHWGGGLGAGYSLYAATALYFVNPVVDYQDGFVLFAEISSVVVTTSVIFTIIQSAIENLNDFILSKSSASTAVFTDNEWGEIYADALEKGYVAEPEKFWNFKNARASAAFLYSEDTKNIGMYRENQEKLAGRDVYLMLRDSMSQIHPPSQRIWRTSGTSSMVSSADPMSPGQIITGSRNGSSWTDTASKRNRGSSTCAGAAITSITIGHMAGRKTRDCGSIRTLCLTMNSRRRNRTRMIFATRQFVTWSMRCFRRRNPEKHVLRRPWDAFKNSCILSQNLYNHRSKNSIH